MSNDTEEARRERDARLTADVIADQLHIVDLHKGHIRRLIKRYRNEPEFLKRMQELCLLDQLKEGK